MHLLAFKQIQLHTMRPLPSDVRFSRHIQAVKIKTIDNLRLTVFVKPANLFFRTRRASILPDKDCSTESELQITIRSIFDVMQRGFIYYLQIVGPFAEEPEAYTLVLRQPPRGPQPVLICHLKFWRIPSRSGHATGWHFAPHRSMCPYGFPICPRLPRFLVNLTLWDYVSFLQRNGATSVSYRCLG